MTRHPAATRTALVAALSFSVLAVLVQLGLTGPLDEAGLHAALAARTPPLTRVMLLITAAGGPLIAVPFTLGFCAWLRAFRGGRTAVFYIVTCLSGWGMYALLKIALGRPRPSLIPRLDGAGWVSFPSGHAMIATIVFGLAMVLATERSRGTGGSRAIIAAGCIVIAGVALSRIYLGVHYPSDVVAGVLCGWAWIGAALAWFRRS